MIAVLLRSFRRQRAQNEIRLPYEEWVQGDSYQWSGININDFDISMKGALDVSSGDDQWSYYSEEMTADGELKYAMVSQCSVRGGQYKGASRG
jgi:hypothetical protein